MKKFARYIEKGIIYVLIVMMSLILVLATVELGYYLVRNILQADYLIMDLNDLMDLFGVFLLVLIGIELLDTIKVYLKQNQVHVELIKKAGLMLCNYDDDKNTPSPEPPEKINTL
ncbi:MAG: phosphate-starvation-inducible PsiE family protein [Mariniphaga sp.]|nr:phosphate-starvation-inducible PsiE family protein [Mariniphaga sp.]